ncbi:MAG: hypothetical protein ACK5MZ_09330 [Aestuariibaculum sp.]
MKKLFLTAAILIGGATTFALPVNMLSNEIITISVNEGFTEISLDQLPEAVKAAVEKDFANATLSKAYVNASEQYKLVLSIDENESTVYADKDGNWLEEDKVAKEEKEENTAE